MALSLATPARVRFVGAAVIGVSLLLLGINFARQQGGMTPFGPDLGADYPAFYVAGEILNSEPSRLYDLTLQEKLYRHLIPDAPANEILFFPSAPFFAVLFRPLALLPYAWSYLAWLCIGAGLALGGFTLLWKACPELAGGDWPTALLASLSFTPLLLEGWIGGQTTALVFFCLAAAIYLRQREHRMSAGAVLAVLAFKPTLLLLVAPMLVVTRSFRVLLGMAIGGLALSAVSLWAVGLNGCLAFPRFLAAYAEVKRVTPESLKPWKYVDLRSAVYPVFYHPATWAAVLLAVLALAAAAILLRTWLRSKDERLAWATALLWTPVFSPHMAVYDAAMLIPAVFLVAAAGNFSRRFALLTAVVYLTAWFSQAVSAMAGFQPLSIAIVLLGLCLCAEQTHEKGSSCETVGS